MQKFSFVNQRIGRDTNPVQVTRIRSIVPKELPQGSAGRKIEGTLSLFMKPKTTNHDEIVAEATDVSVDALAMTHEMMDDDGPFVRPWMPKPDQIVITEHLRGGPNRVVKDLNQRGRNASGYNPKG